jgi:hypothetical protein
VKLSGDLVPLREAYECNIQSLDGVFSPVPIADPSAEDYICWLKIEADCLPQVFASVNENFISVVIEGLLAMTWSLCRGLLLVARQTFSRAREM